MVPAWTGGGCPWGRATGRSGGSARSTWPTSGGSSEDVDRPAGSTNIHPDHLTGRVGALAVTAALIRRARDGAGAHVEVAQLEVMIQLLGDLFALESMAPGAVQPQRNRSPRGSPWGAYPCRGEDEWCVINIRSDEEWVALRRALGDPGWVAQARFDRPAGRRAAAEEIDAALGEWTSRYRAVEGMEALQAHGVPAGVVQHPGHQLEDPHLQERGFLCKLDQPGLGQVVLEGPGFRGTDLPAPRLAPAPLLGQHTRAICRGLLGMSRAEIDRLFREGVLEETLPES